MNKKISNIYDYFKAIVKWIMFDYIKGCIPDERKRFFTFNYDIYSHIMIYTHKLIFTYLYEILQNLVLIL